MSSNHDVEILVQIATMYYIDGLTQSTIAKQLELSRSSVCNMLADAKNFGIVEINIKNPRKYNDLLSSEIQKLYSGLKTCYVVPTSISSINILTKIIASQGADIVAQELSSNTTIGVAWGSTIYEFMQAFNSTTNLNNIDVVPLIGGTNQVSSEFQLNEMVRKLAKKLQGTPSFIHAPAHTESINDRELYIKSKSMQDIVDKWKKLDVAIVSVGSMPEYYDNTMLFDTKAMLDPFIIKTMFEQDPSRAVGDICGRRFNIKGQILDNDFNKKLIAIDQDLLKNAKKVICIAAGNHKTLSIIGALRNDLMHTLITDESTAKAIIEISNLKLSPSL